MDKTVLITGASGGLGSAIALAFAQNGRKLALCYNKNKQAANVLCKNIIKQNGTAAVFAANLCKEKDVATLFTEVEKTLGQVDTLVNCAGIQQQKMFCDTSLKDWQNMIDANLTSTFLCSKYALANMVSNKHGCIINISSMWGQVGASCEVAYSASKAGIIGLTKSLAKEVAQSCVRINCVAPGAINTGMMNSFSHDEKLALCQNIPLNRLGTAAEIADTVVFLASTKASYITGQVLSVNGGFVV